ncbi:MAG: hypothetical protein WAV50_02940 [Minisyncoccia bacterium]
MNTQQRLERLVAALDQGGWHVVEQTWFTDKPPTFEITDYKLKDHDLHLVINLKPGVLSLTVRIATVFLEGRFGVVNIPEPREFVVNCAAFTGNMDRATHEKIVGRQEEGLNLVFARDKNAPPGWPLSEHERRPYGFVEHRERYGNGENRLRTPRVSQPRTLFVGDTLATGDRVLSTPRRGYNSSVLIHLSGGVNGHWIEVASRLPLALLTPEDGFVPSK